ncbi:MAG: hypothetical protein ACK5LY_10315 [Lachnospirales bacterium]
MSDKYYFLCNHWTEAGIGYAFPKGFYNGKFINKGFSTVYTVEKMLSGADEYNIHTSMELDSYSYELLEEVSKDTLKRLRDYIKKGKVSVAGSTYAQPLGQDYGWESNIRQLTFGKKVIKNLLDYDVLTFLVEEQWFHPQLPQLLKKSGFKYASLQCQNSGQVFPINKSMIDWKGIDDTVIPTIPANNIMVSCVRQYADYEIYENLLESYDNPLLFQWVEVWVPGMDWGASLVPFEKAINYVKEKGYISTSIDDYFQKTVDKIQRDTIYIDYDNANYGNDWYQGGGWGYQGDKVIYLNNVCEDKLSALETFAFLNHSRDRLENINIDEIWKEMLLLQNHDVSVARSYRAYTKDGIATNANELVIYEYNKIIDKINLITDGEMLDFGLNFIMVTNYSSGLITKEFRVKTDKEVGIKVNNNECEVSSKIGNGYNFISVSFFTSPYKVNSIEVFEKKANTLNSSNNFFETKNFKIEHIDGWKVKIHYKKTSTNLYYEAFSGQIGKGNEHGDGFYALSPAHLQFTFQFDGAKHCPDQTSSMHVKCTGIEEDDLFIKLKLHCDLLTLHTTDTPVAFASSEVILNKVTEIIDTKAFIYTDVFLNVDAFSKFYIEDDITSVYRDYPFYEEKTEIDNFYFLSYLRINDLFTIQNYGSQRVVRDKNTLKIKLTKGSLLNDYEFKFSIKFETSTPFDSVNFVKSTRALPIKTTNDLQFSKKCNTTLISQLFIEDNYRYVRVVNYSKKEVVETLEFGVYSNGVECNMLGEFIATIDLKEIKFSPYEIKTIRFCL